MLRHVLFVVGIGLPLSLFGQVSSIIGKTYYRMDMSQTAQVNGVEYLDLPIPGIEVILVSAGDTLRTKTDDTGKFIFSGIASRAVTLSMVDDDYAPFSETFALMPGENIVIVPRQRKTETLDAASVAAERPIMTMKGDTLVYHAAALTVREGDFAIDLLMQMPGVEADRTTGQIRISGKDVARSYVNGALVFGLNPMASMQHLRAEQVVTMEVFDETDPEEIIDRRAREKQRVINITTKDPVFDVTDLQFRAIAGADETKQEDGKRQYRYAAGTNAHFFSELVQLSADAVTNNVGMNSSDINAVPGPQSTYRASTDLELGFNKYWESPLYGNGLNTRYLYTHVRTSSRRRALQEYFETAGMPAHTMEEESSTSRLIENHRFETGFAYRTGKFAVVTWRQQFNLSRNRSDGQSSGSTVYGGMAPMLREETSFSGSRGWDLSESVNFRFKAGKNNKPGPDLTLSVMLRQNDLDSWSLDTLASSYTKRYLTKEGNELQQFWQGQLSQILYEFRKDRRLFQLTGQYGVQYHLQTRVQEAYDLYGVAKPVINMTNTYDYTYSNLDHEFSIQSRFNTGDNRIPMVLFNIAFHVDHVIDRERLPEAYSGNKTYYFLTPTFNFLTGRIAWSLGSSYHIPAVEQLRPRIDDTHPLSLVAGNPDLKKSQAYSFGISSAGNRLQAKKWTTTWNTRFQYETTPLVQRTLFYQQETVLDEYDGYRVPAGASVNRTENADFALTANVTLNASTRLSLLKGRLRPTITLQPKLDYRLIPQYFGEVLDRLSEWTPSLNATVTAPLWTGAQATLKGSVSYIHATSREGEMDRKALRGRLDLDVKTEFLRYGYFTGLYSWQPVRDLTAPERNRDFQQLDLAVGVNLLGKDLKICLRGIDLLRSGSVYSITMSPSSVTHTWTPVYGRYFVLDISYRFNNSGGRAMPRYGL
jgi:hypothetical protein